MIGVVTGSRIAKNRDGDKDLLLLQVELIKDEDVRTVEFFNQAGEDTNPALGSRVFVIPVSDSYEIAIAASDGLLPMALPGEKEIYSTDIMATTKQASIKLDTYGNIILNSGFKNPVNWYDLNIQLQLLVMAINTALSTKADFAGAAGGLTLDISTAKVDKILI
jgi:phage gp45-like